MDTGGGTVSGQIWLMFALNILTILGLGYKAITVLVDFRDQVRDLVQKVGDEHPATGLYEDVQANRHSIQEIRQTLQTEIQSTRQSLHDEDTKIWHELRRHRDTLIELTAGQGLRPPGGRT